MRFWVKLKGHTKFVALCAFLVILIATLAVNGAIQNRAKECEAQLQGRNLAVVYEQQLLNALSSYGGSTRSTSADEAFSALGLRLENLIAEVETMTREAERYISMPNGELRLAFDAQRTSGQGPFASMSYEKLLVASRNPMEFVSAYRDHLAMFSQSASLILTQFELRFAWLTENLDMEPGEIFDLARQKQVNLFAYPRSFATVVAELGFDGIFSSYSLQDWELFQTFDSRYISDADFDSQTWDVLVDSLGSFFDSCEFCSID
jgi:hypothetical protein